MKNRIHYIAKLEIQDRLPFSGFVAIFDGEADPKQRKSYFIFLKKLSVFPMRIIGRLLRIG